MIAAIYARKSTEQVGVADEAESVTRKVEHAEPTRKGKAGPSPRGTCTSTMASPARSSSSGRGWPAATASMRREGRHRGGAAGALRRHARIPSGARAGGCRPRCPREALARGREARGLQPTLRRRRSVWWSR